jgi:murein DD-endopeptidase MepM/ murein hydrolase activator NlpD
MTSPRWSRLPAYAARLRPAGAVAAVGLFVAALVASGHPAAVATAAAADTGPAGARPAASAPRPLPDIADALQALAPETAVANRVSRSHQRRPLARPAAPAHRWVRPYGGAFTSGFGMRWGRLHAGIDLAGPWGSPFVAATDGCIEYAGAMSGYGQVIIIRDWDGTETAYGHESRILVHSGCVKAGQRIGLIGSEGDATGPHLHFEVRIGGTPVNPVPFLAKRGVYV